MASEHDNVAHAGSTPASALQAIAHHRLLPVLVVNDASAGLQAVQALKSAGLPCAEITLRTPAAIDAIRAIAADPDVLVGAGTVLTVDQVEAAVAAGARFIVSPGFGPAVVHACQDLGVPIIPGAATATEIQMALAAGIDWVKLFPAEALGGFRALEALAAPFPMVRFVPTGGINAENASRYLAHPAVAAVGGSWMATPELIGAGRLDEIRSRTEQAVAAARAAT